MKSILKSAPLLFFSMLLGACGSGGSPTATTSPDIEVISFTDNNEQTMLDIERQASSIPPWTYTGGDMYSRDSNNNEIEPINIIIRGPIGTLDSIRNRLVSSGKWGYVWGISDTNNPIPCFDKDITFRGNEIDFMLADDVPGSINIFPGVPAPVTADTCGTGTRNHARIWKEDSPDGTYETIYIAASMETVRDAFPIPSPQFSFSPTSPIIAFGESQAYYMGTSEPKAGINCNNVSDLTGVNKNWHFRAVVPVGASVGYLRDNISIIESDGIWREESLGCDSNGRWPIFVERNLSLSNVNGDVLDLYLVPAYEAIDGNPSEPRRNFYLEIISSQAQAGISTIDVEKCDTIIETSLGFANVPAVHCLTEDAFNIGREKMVFDIDNALRDQGVGGASYSLDSVAVGHTQPIEQPKNSGFEFEGDGMISVFNVSSISPASPPLNFLRELSSPVVGTNCNLPFETFGVATNLEFQVNYDSVPNGIANLGHIPDNYFPIRLFNGDGGVWRNENLGCSSNGNWPLLAFREGSTLGAIMNWNVFIVPFGAIPDGSQSGYYILEFGSNNPSDPLIYSKLEF